MDSYSDRGVTDGCSAGVVSGGAAGERAAAAPKYSIVVPFYNEAGVAEKLYGRIARVMKHVGEPFEMVFVNDGSAGSPPRTGGWCSWTSAVTSDRRRRFRRGSTTPPGRS